MRATLTSLALIALIAFLVYSNTLQSSFHFDDESFITSNPAINDITDLKEIGSFYPPRLVTMLSFAMNRHFGGTEVWGYHAVNILIHIFCGFLVYGFLRMALGSPAMSNFPGAGESTGSSYRSKQPRLVAVLTENPQNTLALLGALIFVCHPIQTQAITYISQRFASLTALFYLLSMTLYLKSALLRYTARRETGLSVTCLILSLVAAVLAMFSKQNAFTLPFVILLIEIYFLGTSVTELKFRRWRLWPFLLTLLIIPVLVLTASPRDMGRLAETGEAIVPRADYLFTQFNVVRTYLRLLFFPFNQSLDYDYPVSYSPLDMPTLSSFFLLLAVLLIGVRMFRGNRPASFGILFFFVTLSVESSIIPLDNVIFEHRLYLPLAGFSFLVVAFVGRLLFQPGNAGWAERYKRNAGLGLIGLVILLLMTGAFKRNYVWMDDETLWSDVTKKSKGKARGHYNLGLAYALKGKHDEALSEYREAIRISPKKVEAIHNIGVVYFEQGKTDEAAAQYRKALRIQPDYADAHFNLGVALAKQGMEKEALAQYMKVLKLNPEYPEANNNLAVYYFYKKDFTKAALHLEKALAQGFAVHPEFVRLMQPFRKRVSVGN